MPEKTKSVRPLSLTIFGCGYVGSAVARAARARGWRVSALTRNEETAAALLEHGVEQVVAESLESNDWHKALSPRQDFVLNCVSASEPTEAGYRRSYLEGQRSVLEWARGGEIGRYVFTSSSGVYPQAGGGWVDELASTEGVSARGRILLEAESLLSGRAGVVHPGKWFALRLSGIYGPGRSMLLRKLKSGAKWPGDGKRWLNLVWLDDIVSAVMACFDAPAETASGVFNVSDNAPALKGEILSWLANQLQLPEPLFDPMDEEAFVRSRAESGRAPNRRVSSERFQAAFGWRPQVKSYREGFSRLLREQDESPL